MPIDDTAYLFDDIINTIYKRSQTYSEKTNPVRRTDSGWELRIEVPGVPEDNIQVSLDGDAVTITVDNGTTGFTRNYLVPRGALKEKISAHLSLGVLTITLPSAEPQKRSIPVGTRGPETTKTKSTKS